MAKVNLTLTDVFEWGSLDVQHLEQRLGYLDHLMGGNGEGSEAIDAVRERIEEREHDKTDINAWIATAIEETHDEIVRALREDESVMVGLEGEKVPAPEHPALQRALDQLNDDFQPFVNYMDSHFNSVFDELVKSETDREAILKEAADLALKAHEPEPSTPAA